MVLISSDTCATDTPRTAGAISSSTRRTPGWPMGLRGRGSMPMRASAGNCSASCATPPASTDQASTMAGGSKYGANQSAPAMKQMFSSEGVKAGMANRLQVFSTPPARDTSEMNRM